MRLAGILALFAATILAAPAGAQTSAPVGVVSVAADATRFSLTLADGRILGSADLVGANLTVATETGTAKVRVAVVERDPNAVQGDVWLHTFLVEQPDGSTVNLCEKGPDGRRQGFPLASRVGPDGGTENTPPQQFEIVCSAGARAKCVRFGYRPWVPAETALYNACTRMVRADYGGQGKGTTRNGMTIDIYDADGIQKADSVDPLVDFEAGWLPTGAVCVRHVRVKENTALAALEAEYPHLKGRTGDICTEAFARSLGARLFVRSVK